MSKDKKKLSDKLETLLELSRTLTNEEVGYIVAARQGRLDDNGNVLPYHESSVRSAIHAGLAKRSREMFGE